MLHCIYIILDFPIVRTFFCFLRTQCNYSHTWNDSLFVLFSVHVFVSSQFGACVGSFSSFHIFKRLHSHFSLETCLILVEECIVQHQYRNKWRQIRKKIKWKLEYECKSIIAIVQCRFYSVETTNGMGEKRVVMGCDCSSITQVLSLCFSITGSHETILIFWCKSGILIQRKRSTTPKFTFQS